jgi:hypothetical protein
MNRSRSRSRSRGHGGGGGGSGGGHRPQSGGNNYNRSFDSTGPDVKIRGNASHVYEKYLQLARDAHSQGDRVMAENYLQHAEHYYRIIQSLGPPPGQQQPQPAQQGQGQPQQQNGADGNRQGGGQQPQPYPQQASSGPSFGFGEQPAEQGAGEAEL